MHANTYATTLYLKSKCDVQFSWSTISKNKPFLDYKLNTQKCATPLFNVWSL